MASRRRSVRRGLLHDMAAYSKMQGPAFPVMDTHYASQLRATRREAARISRYAPASMLNAFGFYSANLTRFLPCIPASRHLSLFRATHHHLWMSHVDQGYFGGQLPVAIHGREDSLAQTLQEKPGIVCTMHTGSYRLASYLLARSGIPHALLVSAKVMQEQEAEIRDVLCRLAPKEPIPVIEAEHPASALSILRKLRDGTSILAYADGFEGVAHEDIDKRVRVSFLGQHLHVRRGIPHLAHRAGVPIYPLLNFRRDDGSIQLYRGQTLVPGGMPLDVFVPGSLQYLFGLLGSLLMHYPEQWEGWFYLHEHLSRSQCYRREGSPPQDPYLLLKRDGERYLLNKWTYEITPFSRRSRKNQRR